MATIEKRTMKDGSVRWWLRVFVGRDENGRQRFVIKRFDRKKDAEKEGRRLERQRDHGTDQTASGRGVPSGRRQIVLNSLS